ncbi:hypothetical protein KEM52_004091 [Ascosphaera acerosa]|nr:hypothetical protein KEM52_004091 [Ascosphaera acerosa]
MASSLTRERTNDSDVNANSAGGGHGGGNAMPAAVNGASSAGNGNGTHIDRNGMLRPHAAAARAARSPSRPRGPARSNGDGSGSSSNGGAAATTTNNDEVDRVIRAIHADWEFMTGDCVPVQAALQLMDTSTLGRADSEPQFLATYDAIKRALKSVVNDHHQGFNSSIGTYHKIQSSITGAQARIVSIKAALAEAKAGLLTTRPELRGLAMASQNYDDILQVFGLIEHIQALPEKLEARLSEKRFISAVELLQEALRLIRRPDLDAIGGISDLRTYFNNQETSLTDILVEELHDHLYLKSPYRAVVVVVVVLLP